MKSRWFSTPTYCLAGFLFLALSAGTTAQTSREKPLYRDPGAGIEARVTDLLSRMTLEEKIAQLQCTIRKVEWGKNLTVNGLGGVGPILRSSLPTDAARKGNEIQKLAIDSTRLHIPILFHDEALHGLMGNKATSFPRPSALRPHGIPH
jgi:beta-glucosidase